MKTNMRKIESATECCNTRPGGQGRTPAGEWFYQNNQLLQTMEVKYLISLFIWGSEDIVFCLFLCVLACGVYPVFVKNLGMSQAWFLSLPFDLMRKGKSKSRKTRPPVNNRRSSFCFHSAAQFNLLLFYILPLLPYFTFFWWQGFP